MDISDHVLDAAKTVAEERNLKNISFLAKSIYEYEFPENEFDIVMFHASLHHFKDMEDLVKHKIKKTLKPDGKLMINEYVGPNRLQYPKHQIKAINEAIQLIPKKYRKRFKLNIYKSKVHGSGLIRMILADPSECVESQKILPVIHKAFNILYEAPFGGNILMTALKDFSHHFITLDVEKEKILNSIFEFEDHYLKTYPSDFVFGIYQNRK